MAASWEVLDGLSALAPVDEETWGGARASLAPGWYEATPWRSKPPRAPLIPTFNHTQ